MEVVACRTSKINTVFTAAVAVLVPEYIYGQYLCEQANVGTTMWKFWRARLQKQILYLLLLWLFLFPNIFMANTSVNKQMQAQQCGSCGMQDLKNKYYIYCCCASSFSQESVSNGSLFFVR